MIGFDEGFQGFRDLDQEGDDTKNLKKNKLYEMVSKEYFLPPVDSKGITREYLLQVRDGEVFRVTNSDHKHFEYHLEKKATKKVGVVNNVLMVKKLNMFLASKNQPQLGFTEYNLPEQQWLYKVARYIDQTNLLEFFEAAAFPEPPINAESSDIAKMYFGRLYASQWLFRLEKVRKNKKLFEAFGAVSEKYRTFLSLQTNVDVLNHELTETRKKLAEADAEMHDMIGKITFTYTNIEDPGITPELVIQGGKGLTSEMRHMINNNTKL